MRLRPDGTLHTCDNDEIPKLSLQGEITMKDVVLEPQEILALYASPQQVEKGETVMLGDIKSQNQNIFIVVETTCPLARSVEEEGQQERPRTAQYPNNSDLDMREFVEDEDDHRRGRGGKGE